MNEANRAERVIVEIEPDIVEIVPGYLVNRQADVRTLRQAIAQADYDTVRVAGHNMKGTGLGYGLAAISQIGAQLEAAAKARDDRKIAEHVEALAMFLERVEIVASE